MIDLLLLYGGDVEKFAGDCMIVVFAPTQLEAQGTRCSIVLSLPVEAGCWLPNAGLLFYDGNGLPALQSQMTAGWRQPRCVL